MGPYRTPPPKPPPPSWWERNRENLGVATLMVIFSTFALLFGYGLYSGGKENQRLRVIYNQCIKEKKLYPKVAECKIHNAEHAYKCKDIVAEAYCYNYIKKRIK